MGVSLLRERRRTKSSACASTCSAYVDSGYVRLCIGVFSMTYRYCSCMSVLVFQVSSSVMTSAQQTPLQKNKPEATASERCKRIFLQQPLYANRGSSTVWICKWRFNDQ